MEARSYADTLSLEPTFDADMQSRMVSVNDRK